MWKTLFVKTNEPLGVRFIGPVGEVETGDVHAGLHELHQHRDVVTGGPDGADDAWKRR